MRSIWDRELPNQWSQCRSQDRERRKVPLPHRHWKKSISYARVMKTRKKMKIQRVLRGLMSCSTQFWKSKQIIVRIYCLKCHPFTQSTTQLTWVRNRWMMNLLNLSLMPSQRYRLWTRSILSTKTMINRSSFLLSTPESLTMDNNRRSTSRRGSSQGRGMWKSCMKVKTYLIVRWVSKDQWWVNL